jgi:hypothetical protein
LPRNSYKFWNLLVLMTMSNFTCCKTKELNEWCSFLNDKSIIYIKCFLQTPNSLFCHKPIKSAMFWLITTGHYTSPQNRFLYSCGSRVNYVGSRVNYVGSRVNYVGSRVNYVGSRVNYLGSKRNYLGSWLTT